MYKLMCASLLLTVAVLSATPAFGNLTNGSLHQYHFSPLSINKPVDAVTGQRQLVLNVGQLPDNRVLFKFRNLGPIDSSLTDVYFDDGADVFTDFLQFGVYYDQTVSFSEGAEPPTPPGWDKVSPVFNPDLAGDSDPHGPVATGVILNGVGPGEYLDVTLQLQSNRTFEDAIYALENDELRVAVLVRGFFCGGNETFITQLLIPAPGALLLGSLGAGIVAFLRRRQIV